MTDVFTAKKLSNSEFETYHKALAPQAVPLEQSPLWGAFDDQLPERTYLGSFAYFDDQERFVALASATLYRQRGRNWIWLKHGPLFASTPNTDSIKKLCATFRTQFKSMAGVEPVFIRLTLPTKVSALKQPFEHTMYDQTVVLDLSKSEDELLAAMSQSGRQGIRRAIKAEVLIEEVSLAERAKVFSQDLYPILAETSQRGGFGIHPKKLYLTMLEVLGETARLYVARNHQQKNKPEAWAITTEYDGLALYYYGASSAAARESQAPYLLHWEIIKAMKQRQNKQYDFMGIASKHYPSLANVSQFKLKFSKDVQQLPLTYDLPLQPAKYRALATAIKVKRRFSH